MISIRVRQFGYGFVTAFLITSSYPVGMWLALPSDQYLHYLGNEVTWSFYSWFLVPAGVGLLSSIFDLRSIRHVANWQLIIWGVIYVVFAVLIFQATLKDAAGIPTPDRISSTPVKGTNFQEIAINADHCVRKESRCAGKLVRSTLLSNVKQCRKKHGKNFSELRFPKEGLSKDKILDLAKNFEPRHAYFCEIISKNIHIKYKASIMVYVAILLNFLTVLFVFSFIYFSIFLAWYYFRKINRDVLYILIGVFIILVSWFPLRIYSQWFQWYGDLSHLIFYEAGQVLAFATLLMFLFLGAWAVILETGADIKVVIGGVYGTVAALFGFLAWWESEILYEFLGMMQRLGTPFVLIIYCLLLLFVALYVRAVMRSASQ